MSRRYNTRRGNRKKPNAALYVGYVEDEETPEMIMKKFEEMERIQNQIKQQREQQQKNNNNNNNNNNNIKPSSKAEMSSDDEENKDEDNDIDMDKNKNNGLDENALQQIFNATSLFSVNSLKRNNEIFFDKPIIEDGFVVGLENNNSYETLLYDIDYEANQSDLLFFQPEDDDYIGDDFWDLDDLNDNDNDIKTVKKRRTGGGSNNNRTRRTFYNSNNMIDSAYTTTVKKSNVSDKKKKELTFRACSEVHYMKVPYYPIPYSWAYQVKPYEPHLSVDEGKQKLIAYNYMEKDILSDLKKKSDYFGGQKNYLAILMDPPFDLSNSVVCKKPGTVTLKEFEMLPMPALMPKSGMLFIWLTPELTIQVNKILEKWGFVLVEHASWVMRDLNSKILNRETSMFRESKQNLLLYRKLESLPGQKEKYGALTIKHQRTSDVRFDFIGYHPETQRELKPVYQYQLIETLLPGLSMTLEKDKISRALYLWAPKNEVRNGWDMICDTRYLKLLKELHSNSSKDIGDF